MANATVIKSKPLPPPRLVESVTLNLTADEAYTLDILLGAVGGCPNNSLRMFCDRINKALHEAGLPDIYSETKMEMYDGHFSFEDGLKLFKNAIEEVERKERAK
jgi:hypothetical protein